MSDQPIIPLLRIRGLGPSAQAKIEACGIMSANELALITIAEFKVRCPLLSHKAGGLIKSAKTLVRRVRAKAGLPPLPALARTPRPARAVPQESAENQQESADAQAMTAPQAQGDEVAQPEEVKKKKQKGEKKEKSKKDKDKDKKDKAKNKKDPKDKKTKEK